MDDNLLNALTAAGTLLLLVLIFVGAHYAAKFAGKRYGRIRGGVNSGKLKMLDQRPLGPDRQLVAVQAAEKVLLLGVTSQHVELLKEFDKADFPPAPEEEKQAPSFSSAFHSALDQWKIGGAKQPRRKGGKENERSR